VKTDFAAAVGVASLTPASLLTSSRPSGLQSALGAAGGCRAVAYRQDAGGEQMAGDLLFPEGAYRVSANGKQTLTS
jgi:hypothetical protein